jgi:hypothetical protein
MVPGGDKVMKRTVLLLAILAAFSITSVSQVCASPAAGEKAVTLSSWLSYYFANFLRAHRHDLSAEAAEKVIIDNGDDVILRGDADDYANGRGDDEQDVDPVGPGDDKRNKGL